MSSSPLDPARIAEANDPQGPYRRSILEVDTLLEKGLSLSGHERNVCFLNLAHGDGRFATVSALSGIDLEDDARAVAPVDWDGDGDLDLWISNRTSPLVRFLKNTHVERGGAKAAAGWVQIRVEAGRGARDGIGSRVALDLDDGRTVVRVLKAGEGFLAQTSKWLHFGIGDGVRVQRTRVRWPGRDEEHFDGVAAGGHYLLKEGARSARKLARPGRVPGLAASPASSLVAVSSRAVAGSRFAMPQLPWETWDGQARQAGGKSGRFTLVNLWASWCAPCVVELRDFAAGHDKFHAAGVQVIALSVDGLGGEGAGSRMPGTAEEAAKSARQWDLPFPVGRATGSLVRRVERARSHGWGVQWPLPVPSSLLLQPDGRLAVLYLGPVTVAQVLADAALASQASDEAWHDASVPFAGPWIDRPNRPIPMPLALDLMNEGDLQAAREFVERTRTDLARHKEFATLLVWIADRLMSQGKAGEAFESYASALAADPKNLPALNNMAWHRATHSDPKARSGAEAVRLAQSAFSLTAQQDPSIHDTLAAAYAETGQFRKAVATAEQGLQLAQSQNNTAIAESLRRGLGYYRRGRAYGR